MKIKSNELPHKNFKQQDYLRSLAKAINNCREGEFQDCKIATYEEFCDYLDVLEKCGVICKKPSCKNKEPRNLNHYICVEDPINKFGSSNKFVKWLEVNAVPLFGCVLSTVQHLH